MGRKYWVPSLERAHDIINLVASEPSTFRLIDLSQRLDIHKSSMFSLLNTMETLGWLMKEKGDTYSLGPLIASLGAFYFRKFSILQTFVIESKISVQNVSENIQLGILDGTDVVYLAREEGASSVRLLTDPGMRFPAHASAIGKVQLSQYDHETLLALYPQGELEPKTPFTVKHVDGLWKQLKKVRSTGFAIEMQEGALGFHCVAAPVRNHENRIIAGVSFTMLASAWEEKETQAREEIIALAERLSAYAGYRADEVKG